MILVWEAVYDIPKGIVFLLISGPLFSKHSKPMSGSRVTPSWNVREKNKKLFPSISFPLSSSFVSYEGVHYCSIIPGHRTQSSGASCETMHAESISSRNWSNSRKFTSEWKVESHPKLRQFYGTGRNCLEIGSKKIVNERTRNMNDN